MPIPSQDHKPAGRKLALVVGVNGVPAPGRAPLQDAIHDAQDMASVLGQDYCDFDLSHPPLLGEQATTEQVRTALLDLAENLQEGDSALFFFSGHAQLLPGDADQDEVYLVTHSFNPIHLKRDKNAHLSLRWLRQVIFEHEKASSILIVLDCCYAGKFADGAPDVYLDDLQQRLRYYLGELGGQSPAHPGGIRLALTATGDRAAKEQNGHGLLTGHLLDALRGEREQAADEQGQITFGRLFDHLAQALASSGQTPHFFGSGRQLVLATHSHLSQEQRRANEQAARHAESRQRLQDLIAHHHDGFLQDRLASFVGRVAELAEIRHQIKELLPTGGYLTITGGPGQGKSSIIARLVEDLAREQGGRARVAYHFIPLTPPPDYQVPLLQNLLARLILKHDLSDLALAGTSRAALGEALPGVLQTLSEQGKQEIIFVDGLDQLQPDSLTGTRDLSFLPQGLGQPPPGIVFVLGTRPNDTLHPLELLKPHQQYLLPNLSRADFDEILRKRGVSFEGGLVDRFYEALEENALYLDLVAKELAERRQITHEEVETIIQQISENPENLFSLSIERLSWQRELWREVIKPVLGLLLATSEPLSRLSLKHLLNLSAFVPIDGDQLDRGLASLGGLVVVDDRQRYSLFHLKFREYLHQDSQRPQKRSLFDREDEQGWHRRFVAWCEQGDLARIWEESANAGEQDRRCYARRHYITHLSHAAMWDTLFRVLDEGAYGKAKIADDPSTRAYALDLDLGRQAAASSTWDYSEAVEHLPHLWRYTLLHCILASRADRYSREAFEVMLLLGHESQAIGLAELLTDPERKAEIFALIGSYQIKQPGREYRAREMFVRAERVIDSIPDEERKVTTLIKFVWVLAQVQQWQEAERVSHSISDAWGKAAMLRELARALAQAGQWQEAERVSYSIPGEERKVYVLGKRASTLAQARKWQEAEQVSHSIPDVWGKAAALRGLARALAQAGQWQEAKRVSHSILDAWGKVAALEELVRALAQSGQWQEAERVSHSIPDEKRKIAILGELAHALAQSGQWQEAKRVSHSIPDEKHKIAALGELAHALAQAGQWQEAEQVNHSIPNEWLEAYSLGGQAIALAQVQRWQEAERVSHSIPDKEYKTAALRELARALAQSGKRQEAERYWQEAERVNHSIPHVWDKATALRELARASTQAGQWQEAERVSHSIRDEERKATALRGLARALAQTGQWQEAERVSHSIPDKEYKTAALRELARVLAQAGQWQEAERVSHSIPDKESKAAALRELAHALTQTRQWQEAERCWQKVERVNYSIPVPGKEHKTATLRELAHALTEARQRQEAEQVSYSIPDKESRAVALGQLARALSQAGQWQEAKLVSHSISNVWRQAAALGQLADALSQVGQWQEAEQLINSIPTVWGKADALMQLVRVLAQAGQWQAAERMVGSIPVWGKADALVQLACTLAQQNEYDRLIQLVQRHWLQARRREEVIKLLPMAFSLLPHASGLGMAFFESFDWVDAFLRGEQANKP